MPPELSPPEPSQTRPVTRLSTTLAIVFALLMLYLPFQFQSLPLRFIYPYLRLFGLAYGTAGLFLALGTARLALGRWLLPAGKLLLVGALATQGYLVAYLPAVAGGQLYYTSLVLALVLADLAPGLEQKAFSWLLVAQVTGIGLMMVVRPALFPVTIFGQLSPAFGPVLIAAGVQHAIVLLLPQRWRPPLWLSMLLISLPYGWYAYYWARVGNWVGISAYGTMAFMALSQALYLWRPWTWRIPGLQRRVLALAACSSVLPLVALGALSVFTAQSLDADAAAKSLTVAALQARQQLAQIAQQPYAPRQPEDLMAALRRMLPPSDNTVEVAATDPDEQSFTGVRVSEDFSAAGIRRLAATVNVPEAGMTLTVYRPATLAYDQAGQLGTTALFVTIVIAVLALVAGAAASRAITGPLADVRSVASAISSRHFGARIRRQTGGDDEVSDLIVTVNGMAETLEAYSNELQRLLAVTDTALSHMSLDNLVDQLLHRGREALAGDTCVILLLSDDGQYLTPVGALGLEQEIIANVRIPYGRGFAGRIAASGQPLVVADVASFDVVSAYLKERVRSVAGAPLLVEGRVIGVIHVGTCSPRRFTEDDVRLLQLVADRIALALDHSRLFAEVRDLNTSLERRVTERTAQLLAANKELEAFSYSVSHDLRSPLRNIDGFSQALLEDYGDRLDAQGADYLRRIRSSIRRMSQLIDALLQLSRVTRAQLDRQPVDLSVLVRSVVADLQRLEPERAVDVQIQGAAWVSGDPKLLRIAIENLVHNAWKFTGRTPDARIEFGMTVQNHEHIYHIRDNGAGFDMTYADKLFTAFQRLHPETQFEGAGIGLATVQRIIQRHGGRIWAESAVNQGATFYFTL